jgi:7-cyano-7-deazaguanine synthase
VNEACFVGGEKLFPGTDVPFRKAHFLSITVNWTEALGAAAIYLGAVEQGSFASPDCGPEFCKAVQGAIRTGTKPESAIEVVVPEISIQKSEIIQKDIALGVPLHLIWSC